ncbi:diacylglycerol/lipid kinase family protein [Hyphococcus sp.]|uniref:diacylglycerol/lipid kinase family protein n=1 Tax=Hyphococcus sp. TaxID=2038636 RepID=UPI0035C672FC
MCVYTFINVNSGGVQSIGPERASSILFHELKEAGLDCSMTLGGPADFDAFAQKAKNADDSSMVAIAGGDGTLAMAAAAFLNTQIPVLLLPGGTMNLIAHDLGIGGDLEMAVRNVAACRPRRIDVATINDRAFLNNVVFGDYAEMAEARETIRDAESMDERLGAISEATHTFMNSTPRNFRIEYPGGVREIGSNVLMVSNNPYTHAMDMRPRRKRLDSGKLTIYLAESQDGIDLIARLVEVMRGELGQSSAIEHVDAEYCVIHADSDTILAAVDGEPMEMKTPVHISIKPRALTILRPD